MNRLDQAPPSRYRIEEKDGRLIVHDRQSGNTVGDQFLQRPSSTPLRGGSALNPVKPAATQMKGPANQERAKRGAIVVISGVALIAFMIMTGLGSGWWWSRWSRSCARWCAIA